MLFTSFFTFSYKYFLKNILFLFDPEHVHITFTHLGEMMESQDWLLGRLFRYSDPNLQKKVLGLNFPNPIGLSAGFDYDGHMSKVLRSIGFGFNTVGTVTARPYAGNSGIRLARLPKSRSLLVNKGFKSAGADNVAKRLDKKNLSNSTIGISVGSSNVPEVNTIKKAIADYLYTFNVFRKKPYVKYFELNISCPNTAMPTPFTKPSNFKLLITAVTNLRLTQPIFIKMPNEIDFNLSDTLVTIALASGIKGFIYSNLVKDRSNPAFDQGEIAKFTSQKGNFSGAPTFSNSNALIRHTRQKFGKKIAIIGVGGIFTVADAKVKLDAGADLVQLITGMIFEGPQLIGQLNRGLAKNIN